MGNDVILKYFLDNKLFTLCLLSQYHIKMTRQKYFYKVWKPGAQKKDLPVSMKTMEVQISPCEDYL